MPARRGCVLVQHDTVNLSWIYTPYTRRCWERMYSSVCDLGFLAPNPLASTAGEVRRADLLEGVERFLPTVSTAKGDNGRCLQHLLLVVHLIHTAVHINTYVMFPPPSRQWIDGSTRHAKTIKICTLSSYAGSRVTLRCCCYQVNRSAAGKHERRDEQNSNAPWFLNCCCCRVIALTMLAFIRMSSCKPLSRIQPSAFGPFPSPRSRCKPGNTRGLTAAASAILCSDFLAEPAGSCRAQFSRLGRRTTHPLGCPCSCLSHQRYTAPVPHLRRIYLSRLCVTSVSRLVSFLPCQQCFASAVLYPQRGREQAI